MALLSKAPSGRKIWKAVRDELMLNLYPLPYSTIAPTVYHVYFHPEDFEAIAGVVPRIASQLQQALNAEVETINRGLQRASRRVVTRLLDREELPPIEIPPGGWEVHLQPDHNGELQRGQLGIVSTLAMPAPTEYGGTPTTRIVRSVVGAGHRSSSTTTTGQAPQFPAQGQAQVPASAPVTATPALRVPETRDRARLTYEDDQGPHVFLMRKDSLAIGRGGSSAWVDVQIAASSKISREHLRIRADADGRFFVQDVSLWGTSVDGFAVPPPVKSAEGVAQPGAEHPLPPKARIGLADAIFIDFQAIPAP